MARAHCKTTLLSVRFSRCVHVKKDENRTYVTCINESESSALKLVLIMQIYAPAATFMCIVDCTTA